MKQYSSLRRPALRAVPACLLALGVLSSSLAVADSAPQTLPFAQNWSNTGLISAANSWTNVPGIVGYRGDSITADTGADPQTLTGEGTVVVSAIANQGAILLNNTSAAGGVAEFEIDNPVIGLNGSGTADAPSVIINLITSGQSGVTVGYLLRDLDSTTDNAAMPVALQYRLGTTGAFINVPTGFVADATSGPSLATLTTAVSAVLPAAADNQPVVQVRIITANAVGNDEWVGIDDISITGMAIGGGGGEVNQPIVTSCPVGSTFAQGTGGSLSLSATDADSVVNGASLISAPAGITLGALNSASIDGDTARVDLNVAGTVAVGSYPVQVSFTNNELQSASCTVNISVDGLTTIPQIQGNGARSTLVGQSVTTRGVVTKVNNNGFFMQDAAGDNDDSTSDGVFVFTNTTPPASAAVGNEVRVTATVAEFAVGSGAEAQARPVTELTSPSVSLLSTGTTITPTSVFLPETTEGELERFEGMLVRIDGELTAAQNFFQGRYGQVTLAAEGRLVKPTNIHPAGSPEALVLADDNARRRIILDDGTSLQNPNPTPYFAADNTLRAGDTLPAGLTGVIDYGLATNNSSGISDYKIHPTEPLAFTRVNQRLAAPVAVGGNVRVGSFNVLNYFTTIDQTGANCFPSGTKSDCRGADSAAEFTRQRNKIVPAILGLNADVVGLMEIENNGQIAVQDLVNGLNAVAGAGTYATIPAPTGGTGTDAIRVAMVYKPDRVSLVGNAVSDINAVHSRPPLAQTFAAANGEKFSVVVNHFKSKGSCPTGSGGDADQGDGQGCWNALRIEQATALSGFIASKLQTVDPDVVIVGDLNAYGKEDPILELANNGFVDQIARFDPASAYSYVFDGEAGYLDHALVSASLGARVTGATHWRINADEPSVIDYNTEFKLPDYYTATVYRSSDHDPVILGLSLAVPGQVITGTVSRDTLVGTAGDDRITGGTGGDVLTGAAGADTFVYLSTRDAGDRITDFVSGTDKIDLSALLTAIGYTGSDPLADGVVRLVNTSAGLSLQIDTDGSAGRVQPRPLVTLSSVSAAQIVPSRDLSF